MDNVKKKRLDFCSYSLLEECSSAGPLPEDGEDRISSLPDGILLLILSSLTLKEIVQTSFLSRRWLHLWMDAQVLHLHGPVRDGMRAPTDKECQSFVNWVNHVLKLHRSPTLREFRITFFFWYTHFPEDFSCWLEYALARKVESLELNLLLGGRFSYSSGAYDFDGFLKLVNVANPDKCLQFRSLKSLSLKAVNVTAEAIDFILRNCPSLERLVVDGSEKLDSLVISDPKLVLKYLYIDRCKLEFVSISNINLVFLNIKLYRETRDLRLANLPMLVELSIMLYEARDKLSRVFSQSSCCLSQLRSLTIDASGLKYITQFSELARFTKLKRLVVKVGCRAEKRLTELIPLIEDCSCLEEFVLMLTRDRVVMPYTIVPKSEICSLKRLKVFKFLGYHGRAGDLELVMHILENSVALEKIVIDIYDPSDFDFRTMEQKEECRSIALQQFAGLRETKQPRIIIK